VGDRPSHAEISAAVGAAIAAYTHALDDGRTDDIVATFCADGGCDIPGLGTYEGHDALREAYGGWKPKVPTRHLVVNTLVTDWDDREANATSDVIVLVEGERGWSVAVVGRYRDTLHHDGGTWRFHRRVAEFVT
jgi:hypothetical protein